MQPSGSPPRSIVIDGVQVSDNADCYVIAEIGHNHQGSIDKCKELFKEAKNCGVNAVKLQKRDNRSLYTRAAYDKPYENENSFGPTYGAHREALEFGRDEYLALQDYSQELGLTMFATAFDLASADFLAEIDAPAFKIASGDLKTIPLLKHVAKFGKPMIISTGGADMTDIRRAYDAVIPLNQQLCILQCTAAYPAEPEQLDLQVLSTFRREFSDVVVGLSDHENGIAMAVAAYVLGARVIEKHFTLNHTWKGTDQAFSLEPIGMRKLVRDLRRTRVALGDGVKRIYPSELSPIMKMGKKLVAARPLSAGHVVAKCDIAMKSPGGGLPPYHLEDLIGKTLTRALAEDDAFSFEILSQGEGE